MWGCFAASSPGRLHIVEGMMNASKYCDVVEKVCCHAAGKSRAARDLFPGPWLYQQDNAPCHTAKKVAKWMEDHGVNTLCWPTQSPDLNPIENLWFKIGQLIAKDKPTTKKLIELIIK